MLELTRLGKKFDQHWVFRNLNLKIDDQETVSIVGPSGSGKSVLLKIIAGLHLPDEGNVSVQTDHIGMLFQKNALFDSLTLAENLKFPLEESALSEEMSDQELNQEVARFLKAVGLDGNESLYPDEISGGMQKRLGIARALIIRPKLIIYDEPTAGLDPVTSKVIAKLIMDLKEENQSTVILVTNDMQRAYQTSDRIFLMAQGKLLGGLSPEETQKTKDDLIRQFIFGLSEGPLTSEAQT